MIVTRASVAVGFTIALLAVPLRAEAQPARKVDALAS
jgi:hypothetical protein